MSKELYCWTLQQRKNNQWCTFRTKLPVCSSFNGTRGTFQGNQFAIIISTLAFGATGGAVSGKCIGSQILTAARIVMLNNSALRLQPLMLILHVLYNMYKRNTREIALYSITLTELFLKPQKLRTDTFKYWTKSCQHINLPHWKSSYIQTNYNRAEWALYFAVQ